MKKIIFLIFIIVSILFMILFTLTGVEIINNNQEAMQSLNEIKRLPLPGKTQLISSSWKVIGVENGNNCAPEITLHIKSFLPQIALNRYFKWLPNDQSKKYYLKKIEDSMQNNIFILTFIDWSRFHETFLDYRCM